MLKSKYRKLPTKRIRFRKGIQKKLIYLTKNKYKFTWKEFSEFLNVSENSLIAWSKEKNLLPFDILKKLDENSKFRKYILKIKKTTGVE